MTRETFFLYISNLKYWSQTGLKKGSNVSISLPTLPIKHSHEDSMLDHNFPSVAPGYDRIIQQFNLGLDSSHGVNNCIL